LKKQLIAKYDVLDILFETQILSPGAKRQMKKIAGELQKVWKGIKILLISMLWLIKGGGRSK
jgi:hypothetical protein